MLFPYPSDLVLTNNYVLISRPYVEYKSTAPQKDIASKQKELEVQANELISRVGKVSCNISLKYGHREEEITKALMHVLESTKSLMHIGTIKYI
ncbi:hypothetical protein DVH24_025521 [Malus domestica]|uniref:Uncharacterized protein n=1 Tax=Malus domestica TaxID=3750 RepID=A0A498HMR8_MALDO|nr:hypothetical protein DVH24_025521 [Malus domestica]